LALRYASKKLNFFGSLLATEKCKRGFPMTNMQNNKLTINTFSAMGDKALLRCAYELKWDHKRKAIFLIEALLEIERRKLFQQTGYPTMFEFLKKELKFGTSAAGRRVHVMRLCKEVPEAKQFLANRKLTLTNMARAHVFLNNIEIDRNMAFTTCEKLQLIEKLSGRASSQIESLFKDLIQRGRNTQLNVEIAQRGLGKIAHDQMQIKFGQFQYNLQKLNPKKCH
jgi:hypothetical protein